MLISILINLSILAFYLTSTIQILINQNMQAFDIDIDQEQFIVPSKNQALASQRLEEVGKSKYTPKTYTKGFFNQDLDDDYTSQFNSPSKINEKQKPQQSQQIKNERSQRRSKKSQIKLQPLKQTQKTSVFKNFVSPDSPQQPLPQIEEIKLQNKVQEEPQTYQTRRKTQRRKEKSNKKQEEPIKQTQHQQHAIEIPKISAPILFNDEDEQIIEQKIVNQTSNQQERVNLNQTSQQIQIPLQRNQLNQVFLQSDSDTDHEPVPDTTPAIVVGSQYFTYEPINTFKRQILEPIKKGNLLRLEMIRDKEWLNAFWPEFHLHFCSNSHYLISAKKTSSKPSSTFIITASKNNYEENSSVYLGKMKSNLLGDILNIYGPGLNPSNAHEKNQVPRQVLASIVYNSNIFQMGRPRQFAVYVKKPQFRYYSDFAQVRMYEEEIPLHLLYENNKQKIEVYHNRKPVWLQQIGGYMLNFKGRVECASIKNFILEQKVNGSDLVVFGKVNQAKFNLDITYPISPFIALAIALSSFDSRIMCE